MPSLRNLTICLSENMERLCTSAKLCVVLQFLHTAGSAMRPRSTSTRVLKAQTWQRKNASCISGMSWDVRITMPLMVMSWSMSEREMETVREIQNEMNLNRPETRESRGLTLGVEAAHVPGFQGVVGTHLDLVLQDGIWEAFEEQLVDRHVERRNYFLWERDGGHEMTCKWLKRPTERGSRYGAVASSLPEDSRWADGTDRHRKPEYGRSSRSTRVPRQRWSTTHTHTRL